MNRRVTGPGGSTTGWKISKISKPVVLSAGTIDCGNGHARGVKPLAAYPDVLRGERVADVGNFNTLLREVDELLGGYGGEKPQEKLQPMQGPRVKNVDDLTRADIVDEISVAPRPGPNRQGGVRLPV